jgi:hypothetical protein
MISFRYFHTTDPQNLHDTWCRNFARILYSLESTSSPTFAEIGLQVENCTFCDDILVYWGFGT